MAYEWQAPAISVLRDPNCLSTGVPSSRFGLHEVAKHVTRLLGDHVELLQVRPMDECKAEGHCWVERRYPARVGFRRVRTCDRCHRTTVSLPSDWARPPAHAHAAAR
jgi:hypothetical protein